MKKAALIYNPASGQRLHLRLKRVQAAAQALRSAGVEVTLIPTTSPGSAGWQAGQAMAAGHDTIFACGGDGTVHEVLQGMVAFGPQVSMGIIPLGTGNVLAFDLDIPHDPAKAAIKQLHYVPRRISAGHIEFQTREGGRDSRYFTLMAGVGPDALMLYHVSAGLKKRFGLLEYLRQALRIAFSHPYEEFGLDFDCGTGTRHVRISQVSAVRVRHVGNYLRYFTMASALERDDFHAVLVSTPSHLRVIASFLGKWTRKNWRIAGIEDAICTDLACAALPGQKYAYGIYAQADGEFLGTLPVQIRIVPRAFTLLMPPAP